MCFLWCSGELSTSSLQKSVVAVKLLRDGSTLESRRDFCHEVKVMATFDHENILRLIGIVLTGTLSSLLTLMQVRPYSICPNRFRILFSSVCGRFGFGAVALASKVTTFPVTVLQMEYALNLFSTIGERAFPVNA